MKTKITNNKIVLWIFVLLITINFALSLGISPAKTSIVYDGNPNYKNDFWVTNEEGREFTLKLYPEGPFANYIKVTPEIINFKPSISSVPVQIEINLPQNIPPGLTTSYVIVEQELGSSEPNVVSSKILLKHKVLVQGEYPDRYVDVNINFHIQDKDIEFVSEVKNLGKKDLESVQTKFYVNNEEQQEVLQTGESALKTKESILLTTLMSKESLPSTGEFEVRAVTNYDDLEVELVKTLMVGEPTVEVTYFDKYLIANKINQYSMDLLNRWNKEIKNVFVDVEVKKDGQKIDEFRTKSVDLESEMSKRINDYYNAKDKNPGSYVFELMVNFWNLARMEQKLFEYQTEFLSEEDFNSINSAPPQLATPGKIESGSLVKIIIIIIVVLIILSFGIFIIWRYKHRNEYE
ncbi:MAG: hypothetical protein ABIH82_05725 [Candidatus Woesearchaeota archaeon]